MNNEEKQKLVNELVHKHCVAENIYTNKNIVTGYQLAIKDAIILIAGEEVYEDLRKNKIGV